MGARSGGGGAGGMGSGVAGRMRKDYMSGVDSDLAYTTPGGAVGKLMGHTADEAIGELKETLGGIKNVKTVKDTNEFGTTVDKAFVKAQDKIGEKISILEHNSKLAKGKAKQTYSQAINELNSASATIYQAGKKGYGSGKLAPLQGQFMKQNKWS